MTHALALDLNPLKFPNRFHRCPSVSSLVFPRAEIPLLAVHAASLTSVVVAGMFLDMGSRRGRGGRDAAALLPVRGGERGGPGLGPLQPPKPSVDVLIVHYYLSKDGFPVLAVIMPRFPSSVMVPTRMLFGVQARAWWV
jgi:hypothetical protein